MQFTMLDKKYCKVQEPHSERWENICQGMWQNRGLFKKWMDIIHLGKDELLIKTFGKPTCHILYNERNKVWGIKYREWDFFFFRSVRGDCLQVDRKTPPKVIRAFIADLYKTWDVEVKAWNEELKKMRRER